MGTFFLGLFLALFARQLVDSGRRILLERGIQYWRGTPVESEGWNHFRIWTLRIMGIVIMLCILSLVIWGVISIVTTNMASFL